MNRKQRRLLEKQLGLMKKYQQASVSEKLEIRQRKREMGKKIHLQNIENIYNSQKAIEEQNQIDFIQEMMAKGFTAEEAKIRLDYDLQLKEQRIEELEQRKHNRAIRKKILKDTIGK